MVLLNILDRLVRSTGYSARSVRTLSELDIEDQETGFDVIISDILFDGIAPLDFVFQLKEIILHEMLLIVTNMGQEKVQAELMASNNVGGFFAVPVDMDELKHFLI